jgi:hypothetical protein
MAFRAKGRVIVLGAIGTRGHSHEHEKCRNAQQGHQDLCAPHLFPFG